MKKIFYFIIPVILLINVISPVNAKESTSRLKEYQDIIDMINNEYDSDLHIMTYEEFVEAPVKDNFNNSYEEYLDSFNNYDLESFMEHCLSIVTQETIVNIELEHKSRSTLGTKTVLFNSGYNSMTLTYKYTGSTFDTSYKPTATVKKLNSVTYFVMSSYTGMFKNSNKTYVVTAKGNIFTTMGLSGSKTFEVNFNL